MHIAQEIINNIETIDYYNSKSYDNLKPHAYFIGKKSLDNLKYKNNFLQFPVKTLKKIHFRIRFQ